ncbi:MAG: 3D domain-containing protein [Bacillota bacterium]|nr:3D domain-containing protein [Bacillota bacterium]
MPMKKRIILILFTWILCISGSIVTYAQSNTNTLQNIQQKINQQASEKQMVNTEINSIQQEMTSLNTYISTNQQTMANTQKKMDATNQLIEKKKAEIVTIENKMLARKSVMKKRLVALQHDNNLSLMIKVMLDSKNFEDFIQRASAVESLFNADESILTAQQQDLAKIQADKKVIDNQQQSLANEQKALAMQEIILNQNLQKRQTALTALQEKFNQINQQMSLAQQEKAGIEAQIKAAQEKIQQEQEAARLRSAQGGTSTGDQAVKGQEMYVTATAYTPQSSGSTTTLGYNIKNNPNMKLIAVDPSVIPLGKKVWVDGYGIAIAGDTGGAIVGYRIDVLMPTNADALHWGRRTVKIVVLD